MNLTVERNTLLAALQRVAAIVPRKGTIPIISSVLIDTKKQTVTFRGSNLDAEATVTIDASVSKQGAICVAADTLLNIAKNAQDGADIQFEMKEARLQVRSGKSRFNLATLPAVDFPTFAPLDDPSNFTIRADVLHALMDRVAFAMGEDQKRFFLCGVYLFGLPGRIGSTATNQHRMAIYEHDFDGGPEFGAIVPAQAVRQIISMTADDTKDVRLSISKAMIKLVAENEEFTSKLLDADYADFRRVEKAVFAGEMKLVTVDVALASAAIRRIMSVADDAARSLIMNISAGVMSVSARGADADGADEIEVGYDGPDLRIPVNAGYMLEMLASVRSESITLMISDSTRPFAARSDGDTFTSLLSMLRI